MSDITRGGQFLVKETKCEDIFTPEDFSDSGVNAYQKYVDIAVSNGMRIATVFRDVASIPTMHRGMPVIGGDNSDIRHLEDKGVVVALYAKGKAKLDDTGFVFDAPRKIISIAVAA